MNISETCIRRPVMTTLITASLIVFGIFGYRLLAVAALPAVDFPTIQITATLPGASPETMGASVAGPIERQLSTIAGITSITSTSTLGMSTIIIQFDLNRNIDGAALDVQTALTVAARKLPVEMLIPPSFRKVNPADSPIIMFSLVSSTLPMSTVDDYGEVTLAQQISQLPGISQVLVFGAQKFAVRIQVDPVAAAARGIALEDVHQVLAKTNSNTPVGTIIGTSRATTLDASAAMRHASDYRDVIAAYRNGQPVKLSEIANVIDDVENQLASNIYNDTKSIVLAIYKQSDANTVKIVDAIYDRLPTYRAQIPASVRMELLADRSISIRDSVEDVKVTLMIAIGLVILVIFLFLRSATATIIPSLAVPISLIATCAAMYMFGYLDQQHDAAGADPVGRLRGRRRHRHAGEYRPPHRRRHGAIRGGAQRFARRSASPSFRSRFSLIAVFIPVLLMGGMVGRVFREFAVTITVTILLSGFVSLTLTPMLCARVLKSHGEGESQNIVLRIFEAMFKLWLRGYEITLDICLKHRFVVLLVMLGTLAGTVYLYVIIPKGFFPVEDTGFINGTIEGPSDISFQSMMERTLAIAATVRKDPAVDYLNVTVGGGGANPANNYARMFVALKPRAERGINSTAVIQRLRGPANSFTGMATYWQNVQNLNITGRISKSEFQYTLQSSDTPTLYGRARNAGENRQAARVARCDRRSLYQKSADDDPDRS